MLVAHNWEIIGRDKVQGDETAYPPYSLMCDMDLREEKKWIHKRRKNIHERGNPPISKVESLAETAA